MTQERSTGNSRSTTSTYYRLLDLKPTASDADIRRAYRQKSKLYHPDTTSLPPDQAAEKFRQLKEAYTTLTNAETRRRYDRQVDRPQAARRVPPRSPVAVNNLDPKQRPLSPGEVFALFLLGITFLACLVLALVVGTAQSEDWRIAHWPPDRAVTWLKEHQPNAQIPSSRSNPSPALNTAANPQSRIGPR